MESKLGSDRELIKTGVSGLDEVLLGGILKGNVIVVEGRPGTGKTSLALEFVYRGATESKEPGLVLSFETSPQKLIRDAAGFGWDLAKLEKQGLVRIVCISPLVLIEELETHDGVLSREIALIQAKRVMIDGLTPLRIYGESSGGRPFRESLCLLIDTLNRFQVTPILTTEIASRNPSNGAGSREEQYLADTVITLRNQARRRSVQRSLEIVKSRGQDFIAGRHALRMQDQTGLCVYPRVYARPKNTVHQPASKQRISSGNLSLDSMLGGGLLKGSVTLVGGISGTGKTVLGMQFLGGGAKGGDRCLLVSLDECAEQIIRNAESLELEFKTQHAQGNILLHYDSPLEIELDEHFYRIKDLVEKNKVSRVVIDSVAAYDNAQPKEAREFLLSLADYFRRNQITAFFNFECPELLGISQISDRLQTSAIVDNIVLLNYIEISAMIRRAITIPKARGSKPDQWTREYIIQAGGITILDDKSAEGVERVPQLPLSSYYGVLARSPTRHSPVIDEHVASGKPLPKTQLPKTSLKSKKILTDKKEN